MYDINLYLFVILYGVIILYVCKINVYSHLSPEKPLSIKSYISFWKQKINSVDLDQIKSELKNIDRKYPCVEETEHRHPNELEFLQRTNRWLCQISKLLFQLCVLVFCVFCMLFIMHIMG